MPFDTPRTPSNTKSKSKTKKLPTMNADVNAPATANVYDVSMEPPVALPKGDRAAFGASVPRDDVPASERPSTAKSVTETAPKVASPMRTSARTELVFPKDVTPAVSSTAVDGIEVEVEAAVTSTFYDGGSETKKGSKGVAFFDLDHTIIDTNSSWHWVQHEMNNGRIGAGMIFTAIYWFAKYAAGFGAGAERAGAEAAELYAGTLASDLEAEVESFFQKHMKHRKRPGCEEALKKHASSGERCLICTTSWQHPARSAARLFGLETNDEDVISSVMEIEESSGRLTGKIQTVAYGDGKFLVTKRWCEKNGVDLKECTFYTDSMSDALLMENVGFPVAVNPDARLRALARERGWDIVDWGVAEDKKRKPRYSYGCLNFGGSSVGPG